MLLQFSQWLIIAIFIISGSYGQNNSGLRESSYGKVENLQKNVSAMDENGAVSRETPRLEKLPANSETTDSEVNESNKNGTNGTTDKLSEDEKSLGNFQNVQTEKQDRLPKLKAQNPNSNETLEESKKMVSNLEPNMIDGSSMKNYSNESSTDGTFNETSKNIDQSTKIDETISNTKDSEKGELESSDEKSIKRFGDKTESAKKGKRNSKKKSKLMNEVSKDTPYLNLTRKTLNPEYPTSFSGASTLNAGQKVKKKYRGIDRRPTIALVENLERKPEIERLHYNTIIRSRYAMTTVAASVMNYGDTRDININIILPSGALITKFQTTMNHETISAIVVDKNSTIDLPKGLATGINVGTRLVETRDCDAVAMTVKVAGDSALNYTITYEYLLERNLGFYTVPIIIHNNMWIKDLMVRWLVQEEKNLTILQTPLIYGTTALPLEDSNDPMICLVKEDLGRAELIWEPTISEQKSISQRMGAFDVDGVVGILELRYDVAHDQDPCGQVVRHDGYFAHFFAASNQPPLTKHVVFILDVSDSMRGDPIKQLKSAMYYILDTLQPMDNFTLINFSDEVNELRVFNYRQVVFQIMNIYDRSRDIVYRGVGIGPDGRGKKTGKTPWPGKLATYEATPHNVKLAKKAVKNMHLRVFTNIYDALIMGYKAVEDTTSLPPSRNGQPHPEPFIVFLTDGHASDGPSWDHDVILKMVEDQNHNTKAIMYALGFGSEADMGLLRRFALATNGIEKHIYKDVDAVDQLVTFFQSIKTPVLKNVHFKYSPQQVITSSLTDQSTPMIHQGKEMIIAGKVNPAYHDESSFYVDVTAVGRDAHVKCERYVEGDTNVVEIYSNATASASTYNSSEIRSDESPGIVERIWAFKSLKQLRDQIEFDHSETHQDTNCDSLLSPIDKILDICLRMNYAMSLVTNLVYDGSIIDRVSISPENNDESEETMENDPLVEFPWILKFRDENGFANLPIANPKKGRTFTYLSLNVKENSSPPKMCTNGIDGSSGECRYLPECPDPRVLATLEKFLEHFCRLGSYAGVCCSVQQNHKL